MKQQISPEPHHVMKQQTQVIVADSLDNYIHSNGGQGRVLSEVFSKVCKFFFSCDLETTSINGVSVTAAFANQVCIKFKSFIGFN